jgi:cyclophilin family peptidyl-prolyl cis-trans isomerase
MFEKKYSLWICFLGAFLLLISCEKKLEIKQEQVKQVLTDYGKTTSDSIIVIKLKVGAIKIKLYQDTPLHRANFLRLIKEGYYNKRQFYRVLPEICAQSGGGSYQSLKYLIPNEIKPDRFPKRGALAMARYHENNPDKMSSASEFFIINAGFKTPHKYPKNPKTKEEWYAKVGGFKLFDQEYTIFGEVVEGMNLVDAIANQRVFDIDHPVLDYSYSIKTL